MPAEGEARQLDGPCAGDRHLLLELHSLAPSRLPDTIHPDERWMQQMARNATMDARYQRRANRRDGEGAPSAPRSRPSKTATRRSPAPSPRSPRTEVTILAPLTRPYWFAALPQTIVPRQNARMSEGIDPPAWRVGRDATLRAMRCRADMVGGSAPARAKETNGRLSGTSHLSRFRTYRARPGSRYP